MTRAMTWPTREQWQAAAERDERNRCHDWQRVSRAAHHYLTAEEMTEARMRFGKVVRATRTALMAAGRTNDRTNLNERVRDTTKARADWFTITNAWSYAVQLARQVSAVPEHTERLYDLEASLNDNHSRATSAAVNKAVHAAITERATDAAWGRELERRARYEHGPQQTTITVHKDGRTTTTGPEPYTGP